MVQTKSCKHIFSFYSPHVISSAWIQGATVSIYSQDLVHRLVKVVKVQDGDMCVLFDNFKHATVEILQTSKKDIKIRIDQLLTNRTIHPEIIFLLPLLKKEALEQAVYSLAEVAASQIQLLATAKSRSLSSVSSKELDRLRGIVIAAAEQSKNYSLPVLHGPENMHDAVASSLQGAEKVVFDVSGKSFFDTYKKVSGKNIVLLIGPEGGLTQEELNFLRNQGFEICALTQTTLRAVQAVAVGSALFRLL